jgi:hypothetical protein
MRKIVRSLEVAVILVLEYLKENSKEAGGRYRNVLLHMHMEVHSVSLLLVTAGCGLLKVVYIIEAQCEMLLTLLVIN